jgi:hypothetical protein
MPNPRPLRVNRRGGAEIGCAPSQEVVPGQTEPADWRLRFNITVGASYIGAARSPGLGLADLMLDRLGHTPIPEARSNEAFGLSGVLAV